MNAAQLALVHEDVRGLVDAMPAQFDRLAGKTLLITGASSYITSYMVDTVVWLNDNRFTQPAQLVCLLRSPLHDDHRLAHLRGRGDVRFVFQDIAAPLPDELPQIDFIIHAASNATPRGYLANPVETINANTIGTQQLLELGRTQSIESLLFFSTCEVYGAIPAEYIPTPETFAGLVDPLNPRAVYMESKRMGETLCAAYWRQHTVPAKIARIFHVYGPGMSLTDGRAFGDFLNHRLQNEPIQLRSAGLDVRAFCYVADAVLGYWKILFSDFNGEAFNIGDDREPVSIRDLATLIADSQSPQVEVEILDDRPAHLVGSLHQMQPDITKAREKLGFSPSMRLQGGIARTLTWFERG